MDKNKKDAYKSALIAYALATVSLAIMPYFSIIAVPGVLVVVPMVLIYAIVRGGYALGGAAAVASFATVCFIDVAVYGMFAILLLPFIFATAYALRAKKRLRDSVVISAGGALVGAAIAIGVLQLTSGMGVVDVMVTNIGQTLGAMSDTDVGLIYQSARYPDLLTGAVTQEAVQATTAAQAIVVIQDMMRDALNTMLVLIIVIYAMVMGLGGFLVARAVVKKRGEDVAVIPAFGDYALPKRFWIAALVSVGFAMIGESLGWASFDLLMVTVYYAYAFVFVIQALCLLELLMKHRKMGTGLRVVLLILAALIFNSILMWIGLIENAVNLRNRMKERWNNES